MTKYEIIEQLFVSREFNECIEKMDPPHLRDDLKSEVTLALLEIPDDKFSEIRDIRFYAVRVIVNMVSNKYSSFHKKFRTAVVELAEEIVSEPMESEGRAITEQLHDVAMGEIDKLYWYDAELIRLYMKHGTFRAIQEITGIPHVSVYKSIKKSLERIKAKAMDQVVRPVFTREEIKSIL